MIFQILCVRDRAADVFGRPSFHTSVGGAIRGFVDEINRAHEENVMFRHPEDFDMFHVGTYDDNSCKFDLLPSPRQVAIGKDSVIKK